MWMALVACTKPAAPSTAAEPAVPSGVKATSPGGRPSPEWVEGADEPAFRFRFWNPGPWDQYVVTYSWLTDPGDERTRWEEGPYPIADADTQAVWAFHLPEHPPLTGHRLAELGVEFDGQREEVEKSMEPSMVWRL